MIEGGGHRSAQPLRVCILRMLVCIQHASHELRLRPSMSSNDTELLASSVDIEPFVRLSLCYFQLPTSNGPHTMAVLGCYVSYRHKRIAMSRARYHCGCCCGCWLAELAAAPSFSLSSFTLRSMAATSPSTPKPPADVSRPRLLSKLP